MSENENDGAGGAGGGIPYSSGGASSGVGGGTGTSGVDAQSGDSSGNDSSNTTTDSNTSPDGTTPDTTTNGSDGGSFLSTMGSALASAFGLNSTSDGVAASSAAGGPIDDNFRSTVTAYLSKPGHEGRLAHVYVDTLGHPSVGIGFNLDRAGAAAALAAVGADYNAVRGGTADLTDDQIDNRFRADLDGYIASAYRLVPNFEQLPRNAQLVVLDMMGMGEGAFAKFQHFIAALGALDYNRAADEIVNSLWYTQVGLRGPEDVALMRNAASPPQ